MSPGDVLQNILHSNSEKSSKWWFPTLLESEEGFGGDALKEKEAGSWGQGKDTDFWEDLSLYFCSPI